MVISTGGGGALGRISETETACTINVYPSNRRLKKQKSRRTRTVEKRRKHKRAKEREVVFIVEMKKLNYFGGAIPLAAS